ncbi:choloylglycine hydrolase [Enterococcus sp. JM4C]|uniref:C45 family autoproteolytic acyltransferase/hydolase n=1 Tax=Candidatus Enterococcus huntleyi TaxID=1857217 RepID=UPI00137A4213|nr:C45 family peptidase [Enterococcus sp. JM4C]KAF1297195.1 choloylglycine hydrolase [Enterococcus sp. JM4C]
MDKIQITMFEAKGTNYEIGWQLGKKQNGATKHLINQQIPDGYPESELAEMTNLFDTYCPGLNQELAGFADAIGVHKNQLVYNTMTYLVPGCSLLAILPEKTTDGHVLMARNYDFSHKFDDFTFCKTNVNGRYTHMGGSVALFGRSEGINEFGLAVAQTSCGLPVGNFPPMRKPHVAGLQFWAVIRALLENCKNVTEALDSLTDMPIGYNINLILADKDGTAVLFETLDGVKSFKKIDHTTTQKYIHSTNHAHLPEIIRLEPLAMKHSVTRYNYIEDFMQQSVTVTTDDLKKLCLSNYPEGLCCGWYEDFLGTIKSMVFDITLGTIAICWGGLDENGWNSYSLSNELATEQISAKIQPTSLPFDGELIKL